MSKTSEKAPEKKIILASSSIYRRGLLERLRLTFEFESPDIDETVIGGETPETTCIRLAKAKADTIARHQLAAIVIGCDQVAVVNGQAISKPGSYGPAVEQLRAMSGQRITFHSAVCLIQHDIQKTIEFSVPTHVTFRILTDAEIHRYLIAETPYDCAGSAKSEGLGISLLDAIESTDPTALIGLPLIALSKALRDFGVELP
jgi:septum formation protein